MRLLLLALLCLSCRERADHGLIVLAIDGMDPELLRQYASEGRAPNLTSLADRGSFFDLATSNPPQSPVAWSTFITGHHSEVHGIYDFLHRDPHTLSPYLSTSRVEGPGYVLDLHDFVIPFGGSVELLREGEPFWSALAEAGIPVTVVSAPANYPPVEPSDARVLSGMGTPDLLGTPGLFQVFSTDPALVAKPLNGGRVHVLEFDSARRGTAELDGPPNPFSKTGEPMRIPIELVTADRIGAVMLHVQEERRILRPGEWTDWIPVSFSAAPLVPEIRGMVRAHLVSLGEKTTLYLSPVNMDPFAPAQPISSPPGYAAELAAAVGRYYTQGMPEDTKGLAAGVLSDDYFLAQSKLVLEERRAMLDHELERFEGGFLFMYFSEVDLVSHMFWRSIEPDASEADRKYAHVLPELYGEMDDIVGEVVARAGDRASVMVMSDHGFTSYRWKVNLNAWLAERGYLVAGDEAGSGPLGYVDWSKTRAYAMGLNLLYLNREGREPDGVVTQSEAEWLLARIQQELEELRDPETGARVVTRTFQPERTHHGDRVPDLIIGYARGYRAADDSALGQIGDRIIEPNRDKWSGDHCIDPAHVPGILISSEKLQERDWSLTDLGGWIQSYFGI